jgi:hypothetical protein
MHEPYGLLPVSNNKGNNNSCSSFIGFRSNQCVKQWIADSRQFIEVRPTATKTLDDQCGLVKRLQFQSTWLIRTNSNDLLACADNSMIRRKLHVLVEGL